MSAGYFDVSQKRSGAGVIVMRRITLMAALPSGPKGGGGVGVFCSLSQMLLNIKNTHIGLCTHGYTKTAITI